MTAPLTARKWATTKDPFRLLDHLFPMRSEGSVTHQSRASRWYLIACARRAWERLPSCARTLVGLAERSLGKDGLPDEERRAVREQAEELAACVGDPEHLADISNQLRSMGHSVEPVADGPWESSRDEWWSLAHLVYYPFVNSTPNYRRIRKDDHSVELIREMFANPFRDWRIAADCRTRTVLALAQKMDATGDFGEIALLADALQEAGCRNEDALEHCRADGPHQRGCWVVEAILHPPSLGR